MLLNLEICCTIESCFKTIFTLNPYSCMISFTIIDRVTLNIGLIPILYLQINYTPFNNGYMFNYFIYESPIISVRWNYGAEYFVTSLTALFGKNAGKFCVLGKLGSVMVSNLETRKFVCNKA
ncbi:hypothetical protein O3M35_003593 [Rhynocoris fuscipes]|uniref:Uncharacterized protein n=1 Tax=Rhynocoris fuscipes TaxID=488301 RepID=A0AAW1CS55_9HEMI